MKLKWIKSSRSNNQGQCVEVAELPDGGRAVRDSKDRSGPVLTFTREEWRTFIEGAKESEFDL